METLGIGIKFDRKRFKQDFDIFSKKRAKTNTAGDDSNFFSRSQSTEQKDQPESVDDDGKEFSGQEEINEFRDLIKINVTGNDPSPPLKGFNHLFKKYNLGSHAKKKILELNCLKLTPVQSQSIPVIMDGRDLLAAAPTGSGKTFAFLIPVILKLIASSHSKLPGPRALIVAPTKELAAQIYRESMRINPSKNLKITLLSKASAFNTDRKHDIVICTPLRLISAVKAEQMSLKNIQNLIIDEADKLFELDFVEQIDEIIGQCPETAQKALFSATISKNVEILAENLLNDYISVVVGEKNTVSELVEQKLVFVGQEEGKLLALRQMFQNGFKPPILIFVDNIERAKMLFRELVYDGINVDVIHSQRTQAQREKVISNFRAGKIWVLIATDLMGRGIDFKGVNVVINYDFPHTVASYIHRIGRAGRASRKGSSITYFLREDREKLKKIIPLLPKDQVPKWISGDSE